MLFLILALAMQPSPGFRVIARGTQSGVDEPRQVVIRTPDELAKLWHRHGLDREPPKVDFAREVAVGIFVGSRPTAGFGVEIVGVSEQNGAVVVRYRETRPAPDAVTAQVLTSPYVLAAIPKTTSQVRFEKVG